MKNRKIRSKNSTSTIKIIILFIIIVCSFSVGYSLLSTSLSVTGKGNLVTEDYTITDNIKLEYVKNSWYSSGLIYYQINVKITNISSSPIEGWSISAPFPDDADNFNCWNVLCSFKAGTADFKNLDYNKILQPDVPVEFGFQFSTTNDIWDFKNYIINGTASTPTPSPTPTPTPSPTPTPTPSPTPTPTPSPTPTPTPSPTPSPINGVDAVLTLVSSWNSEGNYYREYSIDVINKSNLSISSWKVDLSVSDNVKISSAWSVNYIEKDNIITILNGDWNNNIAINDKVTFSIQLVSSKEDYTISVSNIIVN